MDKKPTASEIIDALGGTGAVAEMFDIQPPSVSEWRKTRIPKSRMTYFRKVFPEVLESLEKSNSASA